MVNCAVVGCKTGNSNKLRYHAFRFPAKATTETRLEWERAISEHQDKEWNFKRDYICWLHFEDHCIDKVSRVYFGDTGKVMLEQPRKHWALKKDAVPTIFTNLENGTVKRKGEQRKSIRTVKKLTKVVYCKNFYASQLQSIKNLFFNHCFFFNSKRFQKRSPLLKRNRTKMLMRLKLMITLTLEPGLKCLPQ